MLHLKAIEIIGRSLRSAVAGDYAGREAMSLGQYIAGMGFSNVGLGIVHSMAHPLSAVYDIPHGKACAMLLTAVLKFNAPATGEKYREIARVMGVPNVDTMDEATYRQAAIDVIQKLADDVGIPKSLSEAGVKREDIPFLAESAFNDACTPGNPRDVTIDEIIDQVDVMMFLRVQHERHDSGAVFFKRRLPCATWFDTGTIRSLKRNSNPYAPSSSQS